MQSSGTILEHQPNKKILSHRGTLYVGGTGPNNFSCIQDAINAANTGDTLFVFNGEYNETLNINKTIRLLGENQTYTIINGMNNNTAIHIQNEWIAMHNFTIKNSGGNVYDAGIRIDSNHTMISSCIFFRTKTGIYLNNTTNTTIANNFFHTNGQGIWCSNTHSTTIHHNLFTHNAVGIFIKDSTTTTLNTSFLTTNGIACSIVNSTQLTIQGCAITDNNDNQGGIFMENNTSQVTISNCSILHNGFGIELKESNDITIDHSTISWNNHVGIYITNGSSNISVRDSELAHNFRDAIYLSSPDIPIMNVTIHDTNFYNNMIYGLYIQTPQTCTNIDAQNNWWGAVQGPSYIDIGRSDRVTLSFVITSCFPWSYTYLQNKGVNWDVYSVFPQLFLPANLHNSIQFSDTDSDADGCPDWWEHKWGYDPYLYDDHVHLDPDGDALNNLEECYTDSYGSNPYHKDIFFEIDWEAPQKPGAPSNKPSQEMITLAEHMFEQHDITLHIDDGRYGGGEEIPYIPDCFWKGEMHVFYWDYFLHNDMDNPRKGIFHHATICDHGRCGNAVFGWDHLDSQMIPAQDLHQKHPTKDLSWVIISGLIHELGHTLGLFADDHGGIDHEPMTLFSRQWWRYLHYKSCMNYMYTYVVLDYSNGQRGNYDFDDWGNLDFAFFKDTHFICPTLV